MKLNEPMKGLYTYQTKKKDIIMKQEEILVV